MILEQRRPLINRLLLGTLRDLFTERTIRLDNVNKLQNVGCYPEELKGEPAAAESP